MPVAALPMPAPFLSTPSARRATGAFHRRCGAGDISIHALREEGDEDFNGTPLEFIQFLSTPSARRATRCFCQSSVYRNISIHALREEGDFVKPYFFEPLKRYFYPRPPRGGRQLPGLSAVTNSSNFYPRPPRGGRQFVQGVIFIP